MKQLLTFLILLVIFMGMCALGSITFWLLLYVRSLGLGLFLEPMVGLLPMLAVFAAYGTWIVHSKERK